MRLRDENIHEPKTTTPLWRGLFFANRRVAGTVEVHERQGMKCYQRAVLLVWACAAPVYAFAGDSYLMYGSRPCERWTAAMDEVSTKGAWTDSALVQRAWISGYLTARNYSHWERERGHPNLLAELGPNGQEFVYEWMDTYCKAHPPADANAGAKLLFRGLVEQVEGADTLARSGVKIPRTVGRVGLVRGMLLDIAISR